MMTKVLFLALTLSASSALTIPDDSSSSRATYINMCTDNVFPRCCYTDSDGNSTNGIDGANDASYYFMPMNDNTIQDQKFICDTDPSGTTRY